MIHACDVSWINLAETRQRLHNGGTLQVAPAYAEALAAYGWTDVSAVMADDTVAVRRRLPGRDNCEVRLDPSTVPTGAPCRLFLKRHQIRVDGLRNVLSWLTGKNLPGLDEARASSLCLRTGVVTALPVATGARLRCDPDGTRAVESFFACAEVPGLPADQVLRQAAATDDALPGSERQQTRRLLRAVATAASEFHGLGFSHQDFSLIHFFVDPVAPERRPVAIIDLQRVRQTDSRILHGKRKLKDLALMLSSLSRRGATPEDIEYWFRCYFGQGQPVSQLRARERAWLRLVTLRMWRRRTRSHLRTAFSKAA